MHSGFRELADRRLADPVSAAAYEADRARFEPVSGRAPRLLLPARSRIAFGALWVGLGVVGLLGPVVRPGARPVWLVVALAVAQLGFVAAGAVLLASGLRLRRRARRAAAAGRARGLDG